MSETEMPTVTVYTDGGAQPNPGPGGWGVVLLFDRDGKEVKKELSGGALETTNNRMELTAALEAFRALKQACRVEMYTDSQYLKNGINEWMADWKKTAFKKGKILNADLWVALDAEVTRHEIHWHWVKGHAGNYYNERVDELARAEIYAIAGPPTQLMPDTPARFRAYLRVSVPGGLGAGAWAVLLDDEGQRSTLSGGHPLTRPARLDLLAAIAALAAVPEGKTVQIVTANSYLRDGITQWINGWKKSGWMKKTGGEVLYRNLWQRLDSLAQARKVAWVLVKGDDRPPEMDMLGETLAQGIEAAKLMKQPPAEPQFKA